MIFVSVFKFLINKLNKIITINELVIKLNEKFNIELSRFYINRLIKDNNITLKIINVCKIKYVKKVSNRMRKLKEYL